ncbi:unnamed protein product [Rotaria sp. Silwood1]|nr:unnamed protein product [Rotaria sp. Silwood1]
MNQQLDVFLTSVYRAIDSYEFDDAIDLIRQAKRQFNNAYCSSGPATFHTTSPISSYGHGWINNRGGYSINYRDSGGYNRFPKRRRPYIY